MAYTRPWDETTPVGATTLASDIDLVFRQLKQDLRERMNSVIDDWTADPITLKLALLGGPQLIHHTAFKPGGGDAATDDDVAFITKSQYVEQLSFPGGASFVTLQCPLIVPAGRIITALSILADRNSGVANSLTLEFIKMEYDTTPTVTTIETVVPAADGVIAHSFSTSLPYTVLADTVYSLSATFATGPGGRIYGAKVTY